MLSVVVKILPFLKVFDQQLFGGQVSCKLLRPLCLLFIGRFFVDRVEFFHHTLVAIGVCVVANNLAGNGLTNA